MKTANIPVNETIVVYIKYCAVCLKIDYILRCLKYIFVSVLTIKTPQALASLVPLGLLIVITNVRLRKFYKH